MAGGFQPGAFQGNAFQGAQQGGVVRLTLTLDAPIVSNSSADDDALFALALRRRQLNNRRPVGIRITFDAPIERRVVPRRPPRPVRVPVRLELQLGTVIRKHVATKVAFDAPVQQLVVKTFSFDAPIVDFYDQSVDVLLAEIDPDLLFWLGSPGATERLTEPVRSGEQLVASAEGRDLASSGARR